MNKSNIKNSFNLKSILLSISSNIKSKIFDFKSLLYDIKLKTFKFKEILSTIKPKIYSLNNFNCKNQFDKETPND
jgi:hypothetical protein